MNENNMQEAIARAEECKTLCLETLTHCKNKGGEHAEEEHLKLLEDCAKICETAVDFMQRGSDNHSKVCALCAEICNKCADSCEKMSDDEQMQKCAEACRKCAESCREMSGLTDHIIS